MMIEVLRAFWWQTTPTPGVHGIETSWDQRRNSGLVLPTHSVNETGFILVGIWVRLKIEELRLLRFWPLVPLTQDSIWVHLFEPQPCLSESEADSRSFSNHGRFDSPRIEIRVARRDWRQVDVPTLQNHGKLDVIRLSKKPTQHWDAWMLFPLGPIFKRDL